MKNSSPSISITNITRCVLKTVLHSSCQNEGSVSRPHQVPGGSSKNYFWGRPAVAIALW